MSRRASLSSYTCLQIEPESGGRAEPLAEPQGGIGGDVSFASDDLADPVGWNFDLPSQRRAGHPQLGRFVFQNLARMNWRSAHCLPSFQ